jgi:hypothetical protein
MAVAFCPRCGTQRVGGLRYCAGCGLDFQTAPAQSSTNSPAALPPDSAPGPDTVAAPPEPRFIYRRDPDADAKRAASQAHRLKVRDGFEQTLAKETKGWTVAKVSVPFERTQEGRIQEAAAIDVLRSHGYSVGLEHLEAGVKTVDFGRWVARERSKEPQAPRPVPSESGPAMSGKRVAVVVAWLVLAVSLILLIVTNGAASAAVTAPAVVAAIVLLAVGGFFSSPSSVSALARATGNFTTPVVSRSYSDDGGGRRQLESEAATFARHGYHIAGQSGVGSHVNVGRTVGPAVFTGGLSLLFGASRSKGRITITFVRG